jgi:hypothetical protein
MHALQPRLLMSLVAAACLALAAGGVQASCFGNDQGAGSLRRDDHLGWAARQNPQTLAANLRGKIGAVWRCNLQQGQLANAFADLSVLIPRYVRNPACFNGDTGVLATDWNAHRNWAAQQDVRRLLDNMQWKAASALRCLDANGQAQLFADLSVGLAQASARAGTTAPPPVAIPAPPPPPPPPQPPPVTASVPCQGFQGVWSSDFGGIQMSLSGQFARGTYTQPGGNIEGTVNGTVLDGRWIQRDRQGQLRFVLAADGRSFQGTWREANGSGGGAWNGRCAGPAGPPPPPPAPQQGGNNCPPGSISLLGVCSAPGPGAR